MCSCMQSLPIIYGAAFTVCFASFCTQLTECAKVHIALRLSEALCEQRAQFVETKELPAASKTPREGSCGHVVWNKCSAQSENSICNPFEKKPCGSDGSSSGAGDQSSKTDNVNGGGPSKSGADDGGNSQHKPSPPNNSSMEIEITTGKFTPVANGTPFMVAIETANEDFSGWSLVGHGAIIDEVTILTTASIVAGIGSGANAPHLFTYNGLRVLAGASNRSVTDNAQIVGVCAMSVYNDATTGEIDLGLIHLNKSLSMNEHVKKAELPSDSETKPKACQYASWGKQKMATGSANYRKMAYEGTVKMISSPDCESLEPNFFCTTPASCGLYDSGAPLMCASGSNKVVYGISSQTAMMGTMPQKCGDTSVFSSVVMMDRDWVEKEKSSAQKHCKRSK